MTEALQHDPHHEHQSQTFEKEGRRLGAVALGLANENGDLAYPDLSIDIDPERFVDSSVLETPPIARTRRIVRIINETSADQLGKNLDYHVREPHFGRIKSYLAQTVSLRDEKPQRRDIVDHKHAVETVRAHLKEINHPVQQVLAKAEIELKDTLAPHELTSLTLDVLKVTHWPDLKAEYEKQVSAIRASRL